MTVTDSDSALQKWLNWQKHFPAKEGPGERNAGPGPAVCAQMPHVGIIRTFIPEV